MSSKSKRKIAKPTTEPIRRSNRIKHEKEKANKKEEKEENILSGIDSSFPENSEFVQKHKEKSDIENKEKKKSGKDILFLDRPKICQKCRKESPIWVQITSCNCILCDACIYSLPSSRISKCSETLEDTIDGCPACQAWIPNKRHILRWDIRHEMWRTAEFLFTYGTKDISKDNIHVGLSKGVHLTIRNRFSSHTWTLFDDDMCRSLHINHNSIVIKTPAAESGQLIIQRHQFLDTVVVIDGTNKYDHFFAFINDIPMMFPKWWD